jgi:NAD(P)-dependent dehydrogenase (short-subunit alcohol dehydrogenase family)
MRVVVTGANRGIGLELVRQFLARGDSVIGVARDPGGAKELKGLSGELQLVACDIAMDTSAKALAREIEGPVDVLVNNAGIIGKRATGLEALEMDDLLATYNTNALGMLRVTRALLPNLKEGAGKKILNVSTGMGSIEDNTSGGAWAYRLSKAALNMATKNLAHELAPAGISCVAVNPGWVQTDMGGSQAPMKVEESASRLIKIIDEMKPTQSGSFLNNDGTPYPY